MAFAVTLIDSPDDLATFVSATVTVHSSEQSLSDALALATAVTVVTIDGGKFTLVDNAQVANVSLRILSKAYKYVVILET